MTIPKTCDERVAMLEEHLKHLDSDIRGLRKRISGEQERRRLLSHTELEKARDEAKRLIALQNEKRTYWVRAVVTVVLTALVSALATWMGMK